MILAHILLPAMLLVICESQQTPAHIGSTYGNEEFVFSGIPGDESVATKNELLDRYRQLTAKSVQTLYDSCKVFNFLQSIKHNMGNDIDDDDTIRSTVEKDHQQHYINTLLRMLENPQTLDDDEVTLYFGNEGVGEKVKSALYYYVAISSLLQDKELDETLSNTLFDKCCKNDINSFTSSVCTPNSVDLMAEKRNTIKKVKFHSWGGKRNAWPTEKRNGGNVPSNVRMPTNSDLDKDLSQSKIVIRTPFRPWGGR